MDAELTQQGRQLAQVGAARAAMAFSQLAGRTILERVRSETQTRMFAEAVAEEWPAGVLFEFEGDYRALVGLLFRSASRDAVVESLLGEPAAEVPGDAVTSALCEFGNILASQVASAIADVLDGRVLPSLPKLVLTGAGGDFAAWAEARGAADGCLRFECELADEDEEFDSLLVLIPERDASS
ncbi:MAG: chemotaxis protein CheC [Proteobacteria bacterium]|nr:chemotaxis protein CheC [Pseudomonadota bacterium]